MTTATRVLVVDDHRMFADALELLLAGEEGLESMGIASNVEEALGLCRDSCPDVVLMDIDLPGMDGIEGTRHLRRACPDVQVVVITALHEGDMLAAAVEAGACGFVPKTQAAEELLRVIGRAAEGEMVLPEAHIEATLRRLRDARREPRGVEALTEELTPREVEILQVFAEGLSTREVADRLFLSTHTVTTHIGSILRKLGCRSKLEAVMFGLRHRLVELPTEP